MVGPAGCGTDDDGMASADGGGSEGDGSGSGGGSMSDGGGMETGSGGGSASADSGPDPDESGSADASASATDSSGDTSNPAGLGPAPIELGLPTDLAAAGSYVLLGTTGITNVTGSTITGGHVGLSPAAASFITGFALEADASNTFATSPSVVPPARVYASDYASPTPANLTSAVSSMEAGYTDGAGRPNPDFLDLEGGDLSGLTLEPGLYRWGTTVVIPEDVTIEGAAEDVWIFQVANDLDLSTATQIILSGGAQPSNIFWVVAGQVTIHADAHFEGIILSQTAITLQTNATMNGRALAQSLIAIDDNDVTAP
jgi:Ice-binding-like